MTSTLVKIGSTLGLIVQICWIYSAIMLRARLGHAAVRWIYHELKLLFWPAAVAIYLLPAVFIHHHLDFFDFFGVGIWTVNWLMFRHEDDDDDRWKRRRRKIAERIAAIGGRLTVVPEGSS